MKATTALAISPQGISASLASNLWQGLPIAALGTLSIRAVLLAPAQAWIVKPSPPPQLLAVVSKLVTP